MCMSQDARETKVYPEYSRQTLYKLYCDYWPYAISEHSFFIYTIENSLMDFSGKSQTLTNTSEFKHQWRWEIARSLNHCQRFMVKKAWFSKYMKPFPLIFQICIAIICSPMLLIHFSCYFGKRRQFLPPGTYAFLTSSVSCSFEYCFYFIYD